MKIENIKGKIEDCGRELLDVASLHFLGHKEPVLNCFEVEHQDGWMQVLGAFTVLESNVNDLDLVLALVVEEREENGQGEAVSGNYERLVWGNPNEENHLDGHAVTINGENDLQGKLDELVGKLDRMLDEDPAVEALAAAAEAQADHRVAVVPHTALGDRFIHFLERHMPGYNPYHLDLFDVAVEVFGRGDHRPEAGDLPDEFSGMILKQVKYLENGAMYCLVLEGVDKEHRLYVQRVDGKGETALERSGMFESMGGKHGDELVQAAESMLGNLRCDLEVITDERKIEAENAGEGA